MTRKKIIYSLLFLKLAFFSMYFVLEKKWLIFGEQKLAAEEIGAEAKKRMNEAASAESTDPNKIAEMQKSEIKDNETNRTTEEEISGNYTHKGYLEDLLKLPELNTQTTEKEELGKYFDLADRIKQQTEERLKILEKKSEQLKLLEDAVEAKIKRLEEEKQYFARTIQNEKQIQEDRLKSLVELYEKMEPKKAGPVFESMDKDLVVALFKRLQGKQVTKILEAMNPTVALKLTEYYGRIDSAREYDLLKEMNKSLQKAFNECKGLPDDTVPEQSKASESEALKE